MATTNYCTPEQIAFYINFDQAGSNSFTATTVPSKETVNMFIRQSEREIERFTNNTWRIQRSQDYEYLDSDYINYTNTGVRFKLLHSNVLDLDADEGDVLQVWNGSSYEDWLADETEGRAEDFWLNYKTGELFFRTGTWSRPLKVRIKYRWNSGVQTTLSATASSGATSISINDGNRLPYSGSLFIGDEMVYYETRTSKTLTSVTRGINNTTAASHNTNTITRYVPEDVQEACVLFTAARIVEFDDRSITIPENPDTHNINNRDKHAILKRKGYELIGRYVNPYIVRKPYDIHTGYGVV